MAKFLHQCHSLDFSGTMDGISLLVHNAKTIYLVKTPVGMCCHFTIKVVCNSFLRLWMVSRYCVITVAPGLFAAWKDVPIPSSFPFCGIFSFLSSFDMIGILPLLLLHCTKGRQITSTGESKSRTKKSSWMLFEILRMPAGSPHAAT